MTRAQQLTMLRRRLQEVTAAQWTDAVLNTNLNLGLSYMQKKVLVVDPEAFIYTDTTPLVNAQRDYPKPVGFNYEIAVYISTNGGTSYTLADAVDYRTIIEAEASGVCYAHKGRFFVLYPTPSGASAAGLKIEWVPTLSMGSDDDVPDLNTNLHEGIVYRAEMISLGDTSQEAQVAAVELKAVVDDIKMYYRKSAVPERIRHDFSKWDVE
jgi:hypothetical protein